MIAGLAALTFFVVIDQLRLFGEPLLSGWLSLETQVYFALIALLLPGVFWVFPSSYRHRWSDRILSLLGFVAPSG